MNLPFHRPSVACVALAWVALLATVASGQSPSQVMKTTKVPFDCLTIEGSPPFCDQVQKALLVLKNRAPESFAIVTNYVGTIRQSPHSGMNATKKPPVFDLNDRSAFYSVTWCAGAIAHDSFHSKLYHDYKQRHHWFVPRKVWTGEESERKCLEHQLAALRQIGAGTNEIAHCQAATLDYVKVPYGKRNW